MRTPAALVVFAMLAACGLAPAHLPRNPAYGYRVTLYSGGQKVGEWTAKDYDDKQAAVAFADAQKGGLALLNGTYVIEALGATPAAEVEAASNAPVEMAQSGGLYASFQGPLAGSKGYRVTLFSDGQKVGTWTARKFAFRSVSLDSGDVVVPGLELIDSTTSHFIQLHGAFLIEMLPPAAAGFLVQTILYASQAGAAGVVPGDVLVEYDGTVIAPGTDLPALSSRVSPTQTVKLTVYRPSDGLRHTFVVYGGQLGVDGIYTSP